MSVFMMAENPVLLVNLRKHISPHPQVLLEDGGASSTRSAQKLPAAGIKRKSRAALLQHKDARRAHQQPPLPGRTKGPPPLWQVGSDRGGSWNQTGRSTLLRRSWKQRGSCNADGVISCSIQQSWGTMWRRWNTGTVPEPGGAGRVHTSKELEDSIVQEKPSTKLNRTSFIYLIWERFSI